MLLQVPLGQTLFGNHPVSSYADRPIALISDILPNVYVFASLILLAYLVFGGVMMITSAGADQTQKGQQIISNAIIGFLIVFASFWIIQIVQILTGVSILDSSFLN